ncbi:MAG: nitroreductase [Pseudorhodobacter sp.]|nr:nitroreductase [Pseudorhodobacter sp.]
MPATKPASANPAALEFLLTRRSRPVRTLVLPVPDRAQLHPILTAAARAPDHAKLEPWRFIVLERPALARLTALARSRAQELGLNPEQSAKGSSQFDESNLAVVVVSSPKPSEKAPAVEQLLSAGAVCLGLLNAALASGWGACWLTGWPAHDGAFVSTGLGLLAHERVAGIIHIGSETSVPPERPRPDLAVLTRWVSA